MIDELVFAIGVTGPILCVLLLGAVLRRVGLMEPCFTQQATRLVFNVAMPVMLFMALARSEFTTALDIRMTLVGLTGTAIVIGLALFASHRYSPEVRGVFVQGAYRGNLNVVSVALALAAYGESVLPVMAVYLAFVTTLYNIAAVWLLNAGGALRRIATNPIILGIAAGSVFSLSGLELPQIAATTGGYIANMTLPLALLCIGASMEWRSLKSSAELVGIATIIKLVVSPCLLLALAVMAGVHEDRLGILFLLSASPTASASYIMARQMTTHGTLAASIVASTTAFAAITITFGIALLRWHGLA